MGIKDICQGRGTPVYEIPLDKIKIEKGQNVRYESFGDLFMLAMQLIAQGQLEPCIGRYDSKGDYFIITAGERRFRAAQIAVKQGWKTNYLRCVTEIKGMTEAQRVVTMLQENESSPLTAMEKAKAYERLIKAGYDAKQISVEMGCTQASVKGLLALISAPEAVQKAVEEKRMSATAGIKAAKASPEKQEEIKAKVERGEKVSVKAVEEHRTQFSLTEIEAAMKSVCYECLLKKDLLNILKI